MLRIAVPTLVAAVAAATLTPTPAASQGFLFGDSWTPYGRYYYERGRRPPPGYGYGYYNNPNVRSYVPGQRRAARPADDDDDDRSARAEGPKLLDGGGRPDISPIRPTSVSIALGQPSGTIVIDTRGRALYLVTGSDSALRYPISVGREGFTWVGTEKISRIADWPDWHPPAEMRERDPRLPEKMTGGIRNPLGAKSLYLGNSLYRIHGTNDAKTIGVAASSGCFRMLNGHVIDLSNRVSVGTKVVVISHLGARPVASNAPATTTGSGKPQTATQFARRSF